MIKGGKQNLLGVYIDAVDYEAAVARVLEAARSKQPLTVSALAVHGVMTGVLDANHRYRLNHLDLVVPDGQPVRWALNWLHHTQLTDRVYGPNLMWKICTCAAEEGLPIYLYGSRGEVLGALCQQLTARIPDLIIAGTQPSLFRRATREEKPRIAESIQQTGAAIVFVGLGCPRQEVFIYEYRDCLSMPLVAVGAAFDFHAGLLAQAPASFQRRGLEWLYRLYREPRRLWKRYLLLNPFYLSCLFAQATQLRKFDPEACMPPQHEELYA